MEAGLPVPNYGEQQNTDKTHKNLLDKRDCQVLLKQPNSGQLIYQVLTTNQVISANGLKLLSHKKETLNYIKSLSGTLQ